MQEQIRDNMVAFFSAPLRCSEPRNRQLSLVTQFPFAFSGAILNLSKDSERNPVMANITRSAEYRYFSFTYFYGKAYFGLAENARDRV